MVKHLDLSDLQLIYIVIQGTTSNGFVIWHINTVDEDLDNSSAIVLALPYGIRNISTKMLQSNSIMISGHKNYAIAGVRYAY